MVNLRTGQHWFEGYRHAPDIVPSLKPGLSLQSAVAVVVGRCVPHAEKSKFALSLVIVAFVQFTSFSSSSSSFSLPPLFSPFPFYHLHDFGVRWIGCAKTMDCRLGQLAFQTPQSQRALHAANDYDFGRGRRATSEFWSFPFLPEQLVPHGRILFKMSQ